MVALASNDQARLHSYEIGRLARNETDFKNFHTDFRHPHRDEMVDGAKKAQDLFDNFVMGIK